ncbi:MAG: DUF423 domain-containing protein [Deltaproteobacteria bacterium]|nr:DUF423 domain-containing protein [Deltaproteobacteria bacterium]
MTADRILLAASGVLGFLGVALGAFGAHGLRTRLESLPDFARRMEWWETAARYHLIHALAIGLVALLAARGVTTPHKVAGGAFSLGILLFSGSLYAMTLTGVRGLGAVTPLGGLAFLVGWGCLVWSAFAR